MAATLPTSPEALLDLSPERADRLLTELERTVPLRPPLVTVGGPGARTAFVFGDTHGDWRTTEELLRRFGEEGGGTYLVGLGDYIDRCPPDCGPGSIVNALWLLSATARWPDRVYLLQGNHEMARSLGVVPHTLPDEVQDLWKDPEDRYDRIMALLERGAIAAVTTSGAYLAHAGFPRGELPHPWTQAFERMPERRLFELVWAECDASHVRRGAIDPWGADDLARFLAATGLVLVLRGHDPDLTGRALYGNRCLTLHTTRTYDRPAGVVFAKVPISARLHGTDSVELEHLATERKRFASSSSRGT